MSTDIRYPTNPQEFDQLSATQLRERFVVENLFEPREARFTLSFSDRLIIGGVMPAGTDIALDAPEELRSQHFLDRRELAIVCIEGSGSVTCNGLEHTMLCEDILYVGQGTESVTLSGDDAVYYLVSAPAHASRPTVLTRREEAQAVEVGDQGHASLRTIRKYVHESGVISCQLAVGITTLERGSVWNTMPCHTHDRRSEIYLYFGLAADDRVVHLCGQPQSTRSVILADRQAVISPPWSIHTGAGTAPYRFVWATGGENLAYNDMDPVDTRILR